jgi:hypothetical protein
MVWVGSGGSGGAIGRVAKAAPAAGDAKAGTPRDSRRLGAPAACQLGAMLAFQDVHRSQYGGGDRGVRPLAPVQPAQARG